EEVGVRAGVGDDEVRRPERMAVNRFQGTAGRRARPEAPAIADERVGERYERVEDDRSACGGSPCRREIEMAGIAHDERVELPGGPAAWLGFGKNQPRRGTGPGPPIVSAALPNGDMALAHLDAGIPERRDHLRVPRVVALVGAEVEDAHVAGRPGRA